MTTRDLLLVELLRGAGHGLELAQRIRRRSEETLVVSAGALYPALEALEDDGLVTLKKKRREGKGGQKLLVAELTAPGGEHARRLQRGLAAFAGPGEPTT